ncbi:MAG TPA: hypothetical protein VGF79_08405 [Bacteroidia bacterium]
MELDPKYRKGEWDVPEGYFEGFEDKVLKRLESEKSPKFKVYIQRNLKYFAAVAASLAIFIGVYTSQNKHNAEDSNFSFNDLDSSELVAFEDNVELSEEEFEEFIPEATIDSLYQSEFKIEQEVINGFSKDELEDLEEEFMPLDEDI